MSAIDRIRAEDERASGPRPLTWLLFLAGMGLSAISALWFGRNVTFTGDEMSMISLVANLEPGELFEPYVGHLVPVAFLAYKAMIETVGTSNYFLFQMMGLGSIFLMGAGLLYWGCRRVPDMVALAPTLVLILFTGDLLHYVAGNGFTIVFSLACGIWAINAWERDSRLGDIAALALLAIGMMTYTTGVAFAVGLFIAALVGDRKRIWVAGAPLFLYVLWRILIASASTQLEDTGPDWINLFLLPAWVFQGIGGGLESLSGLGFDFNAKSSLGSAQPTGALAPVLAVGFFGLIIWRLRTRGIPRSFWTVAAVALALFTSQVLVWGSFLARGEPIEPRYLYPGALALILMGLELVRGVKWDRTGLGVLWVVAAVAIVSNFGFLINSVQRFVSSTNMARAEATAIYILETVPEPPPAGQQPRSGTRKSFDPVATLGFPSFSFDEGSLDRLDPDYSKAIDLFLARSLDLRLEATEPGVQLGACQPALAEPGKSGGKALLPEGRKVILESPRELALSLGRYGKNASFKLGLLSPDSPAVLDIPPDDGTSPWFLQTESGSVGTLADLRICAPRKG